MVLAEAQTTASTGAIWVIIIVATVALAFWLVAINLADRSQVRASGPAPAGTPAAGRVSGERAGEIPSTAVREPLGVPAQGRPAPDESAPEGDIPTRADLPAQRTGDADRAARSHAARDDEEPGR